MRREAAKSGYRRRKKDRGNYFSFVLTQNQNLILIIKMVLSISKDIFVQFLPRRWFSNVGLDLTSF